jgi:heme exporter protein D
MASQLGRFAFLMPLMTLVLIKGPFAQLRGQSLWAVPAAFAYLSLVGNNVMLNQFGFDRHGIKTLLLLPVTAEDLLKGKLLGMAVHQSLLALLLVILLAVFTGASLAPLLAGVLMLGCVFLAQGAVGQWTSLSAPRPMAMDSLKNSNLPFGVVMLSLATSGVWTSLFGGTYAFTMWFAPAWLVPVMAVAFLLTLSAHLAILPTTAAYLDRRREVLVERLG